MRRREMLKLSGGIAAGAVIGGSLWRRALAADPAMSGAGPYGPLLSADANGIRLPAGFQSREIARAGETVGATAHVWHVFPDGGATLRAPGGWVYVSNSESTPGGVGAIRFDRMGAIVAAYAICSGTARNCAGGATPWRTWLTCEEVSYGHVWECDPTGALPAVQRPALGGFRHEAAAVDSRKRCIYLTEDETDGRFYRFRPVHWPKLDAGTLEVAAIGGAGEVTWHAVPDPDPSPGNPTRLQVPASTAFNGGEGIVYRRGHATFTTKGDDRVWDYDAKHEHLEVVYDAALDPAPELTGVDNITAARNGDLFVAEDGGTMDLVMITPDRIVSPFLRIEGQPGSEIAGPAFDPSGKRLYFSSQRGGASASGITYEVSGPFRRTARRLS